MINKDDQFLPNSTLVYDIEYVPKGDSFRTCKKVCKLMENGILAIFGPPSNYFLGMSSRHWLCSVTNNLLAFACNMADIAVTTTDVDVTGTDKRCC